MPRKKPGLLPLSQEFVVAHLAYDVETGIFTRKKSSPNSRTWGKAGDIAAQKHGEGYVIVSIGGHCVLAHRLAIFYMTGKWPVQCVDHIDGKRANNAYANLRQADNSQNSWNSSAQKVKKNPYKGIAYVDRRDLRKRWLARIQVRGKKIFLGCYHTAEEAYDAYKKAAIEHFGEFAKV